MDAEPPRIVLEGRDACPDADRVRAWLDQSRSQVTAPSPGWALTLRFARNGPADVRAEAVITNSAGERVARRTLAGSTECEGLGRAVAVWAALVLDRERARALRPPGAPEGDLRSRAGDPGQGREAAGGDGASAASPLAAEVAPAPAGSAVDGALVRPSPEPGAASVAKATASPDAPSPARSGAASEAAALHDAPSVDASTERHRPERRLIEVGIGTFLLTGNGSNAVLGSTAYGVIEASRGFFVRPALLAGESVIPLGDSGNANALLFAGRLDACLRVPGNHNQNRGLELALCGGADFGVTYFPSAPPGYAGWGAPAEATVLPLLSMGPSLDLRGDLGSGWSLVLRGVAGVNVIRKGFSDMNGGRIEPAWASGRVELALAWRVR